MSTALTLKTLMILASMLGSSSASILESHDWTSDPWTGCAATGTEDDADDWDGTTMSSMSVLPERGTSDGNGSKSGTCCKGGSCV